MGNRRIIYFIFLIGSLSQLFLLVKTQKLSEEEALEGGSGLANPDDEDYAVFCLLEKQKNNRIFLRNPVFHPMELITMAPSFRSGQRRRRRFPVLDWRRHALAIITRRVDHPRHWRRRRLWRRRRQAEVSLSILFIWELVSRPSFYSYLHSF